MTTLRQFDRTARLVIAELGDPFGIEIEFANDLGLRMSFDITKTNDLQPNQGTVTIYNLSEDLRNDLTGKVKRLLRTSFGQGDIDGLAKPDPELTAFSLGTAYVKLSAGFGSVPVQILEGNSTSIESTHSGDDWRTVLAFGDGDLQTRGSIVSRAFAPGTPFATVITYLVNSLGVDFDPVVLAQALAPSPSVRTDFPKGVTLSGSAVKNLENLLAFIDIKASIQDGRFQIHKDNGTVDDVPVNLSLENGLLEKPRPLEDGGYEVLTAVTGELYPGRPVNLLAEAVQGLYRVDQVNHKGGTHGGAFHSTSELREPFAVDI